MIDGDFALKERRRDRHVWERLVAEGGVKTAEIVDGDFALNFVCYISPRRTLVSHRKQMPRRDKLQNAKKIKIR